MMGTQHKTGEIGRQNKTKVYRNTTEHCYVGRPLTVPKWVTFECCPHQPAMNLALGPHDEIWCDDGRIDLMVNSSSHHQVCIIGSKEAVEKEMEDLNVKALEGRRMQCESPDGKLVARTFTGIERVLTDVTEENQVAIEKGGTKVAAIHVVELQDELSRERREKEELRKKLASLEERHQAQDVKDSKAKAASKPAVA
jgi:hypothetical protein